MPTTKKSLECRAAQQKTSHRVRSHLRPGGADGARPGRDQQPVGRQTRSFPVTTSVGSLRWRHGKLDMDAAPVVLNGTKLC